MARRQLPIACVALVLALQAVAPPAARAEWTRVTALPAYDTFSVYGRGDTLLAGPGGEVYRSVDAGLQWTACAPLPPSVGSIDALWLRNGRIWAGAFGHGVFTGDDLGSAWVQRNDGLTGGFFDSHLYVDDLEPRGDSLYAATAGAGVYVTGLLGPVQWSRYGDAFLTWVSENVTDLATLGGTLLASAGANALVFTREPGAADWTPQAPLVPPPAGLEFSSVAGVGGYAITGSAAGYFRSTGAGPAWDALAIPAGQVFDTRLAVEGDVVYAAVNHYNHRALYGSTDFGATWTPLAAPTDYVYQIALVGGVLYSAQQNGLWRMTAPLDAGPRPAGSGGPRLEAPAPNPTRGDVRLRFWLPRAADVRLEVFSVAGRRVAALADGPRAAGVQDVVWSPGRLSPGLYFAILTAGSEREVARITLLR